jgi:hypothetical protein
MTTATTDILEKLREEIEFINKDDSREKILSIWLEISF